MTVDRSGCLEQPKDSQLSPNASPAGVPISHSPRTVLQVKDVLSDEPDGANCMIKWK